MSFSNLKAALLVGSVLAPLSIVSPAFAQVAAPEDPDVTNDLSTEVLQQAPKGGLTEIIVTARKRQESVQDVPVAVTAISEEVILNRDITSIEKIASIAPQLNVGRASNGSGAQLTMRGIGSSSTSIGIEQSVAVVVDGAYYGQGRVINEGFFDLQRVEVLKGPQALFFGKNATAGVISLTTNDPGPEAEYIARAGYEFNAQQWRVEGIASMPLSDRLGVRLAARYSKAEGGLYDNVQVPRPYTTIDVSGMNAPIVHTSFPVTSDQPGDEELLTRATVKFEATDRLTATLKGSYNWSRNQNSSWNYAVYACGREDGITQLSGQPCTRDFVTQQNAMPAEIAANFPYADDGEPYNRYESAAGTLNLVYDAEVLQIAAVTNYQWNNNQWLCVCDYQTGDNSGTWATENSSWTAWSQELRALSQLDGPLNFMVGALYQNTKRDYEQYVHFAGVRDDSASPRNQYISTSKNSYTDGETFAFFGQLTWNILETLELAAGARYTDETKSSFFAQPVNNPAVTGIFRPADAPDGLGTVFADQHFEDVSPEATLTWTPNPDLLVYGAYKTAYKSGGFSNGGINSAFITDIRPADYLSFDKERAQGFEAGIKFTTLENQLRLNLIAFTYDYKDLQVDFFNSPTFAFLTLTADAKTEGVEFDFEFAPYAVTGLNVYGSINYTDARYTDFGTAPCYAGQTIAAGCNQQFSAGTGGFTRQDLNGTQLSVAPTWTGNLGVSYEREVGNDYFVGFNVDARYSGSYLASAFGNPLSRQGEYATLDAGLRFGAADDSWQLAVIGKNLTNQFYVTGVVDNPSTGFGTGTNNGLLADQAGFGNAPRTVAVEVTTRF